MDRSAEDGHQRRPGGNWFTGIEAEAVSENLPAKAKVDAAQVLNGFSFSLAVPQISWERSPPLLRPGRNSIGVRLLPKEKSGRNCKKSARILGPGDHVTRELV